MTFKRDEPGDCAQLLRGLRQGRQSTSVMQETWVFDLPFGRRNCLECMYRVRALCEWHTASCLGQGSLAFMRCACCEECSKGANPCSGPGSNGQKQPNTLQPSTSP